MTDEEIMAQINANNAKINEISARKKSTARPERSRMIPQNIKGGGVTLGDPTYEAEKEKEKELLRSQRDRIKARAMLEQSLGLWGDMASRTYRDTDWLAPGKGVGLKPGRIAGIYNWLGDKFGFQPEVRPFEGDKPETAVSLAKIASPSSRPGPQMISTFERTLPKGDDKFEEARKQVVSSTSNAIYSEMSRKGENPDMYQIRAMVDEQVNDLIRSRPDIWKEITPPELWGETPKSNKDSALAEIQAIRAELERG